MLMLFSTTARAVAVLIIMAKRFNPFICMSSAFTTLIQYVAALFASGLYSINSLRIVVFKCHSEFSGLTSHHCNINGFRIPAQFYIDIFFINFPASTTPPIIRTV